MRRNRFRFRHADVPDLGVRVEAPRNVVVAHRRAPGEEHVAHELHGLVRGHVRELHADVNVAAGPYARHGGLQVFVDDDEAAIRLHAGSFEPEGFGIRAAAAGDENFIDVQLRRFAELVLDPDGFSAAVDANRLCRPPAADGDPFLGEDLANAGDDGGVFFVDDVVEHLHDDDFAAESPEDLGELDTDVPAA